MESYGLGLDYLMRLPSVISALTKDDLRAAIRRYWNPDAAVIAVAGPPLAGN
jgi:predicted Zn-dependent peptidase